MLVMAQNNLLKMLENTDAWFVMLDKPPQDLNEDLLNTEDFPWDEAHEMIDSGAAKEQLRYSLEGGTLVVVYAIAEKPEAETAAG
jgi:hypothetical protein